MAAGTNIFRIRELVFARQRGFCFYCRHQISLDPQNQKYFVLDHLVPKSKGGEDGIDNRVGACKECDGEKANRLPTHEELGRQKDLIEQEKNRD